jgi:hypothetical protein
MKSRVMRSVKIYVSLQVVRWVVARQTEMK